MSSTKSLHSVMSGGVAAGLVDLIQLNTLSSKESIKYILHIILYNRRSTLSLSHEYLL